MYNQAYSQQYVERQSSDKLRQNHMSNPNMAQQNYPQASYPQQQHQHYPQQAQDQMPQAFQNLALNPVAYNQNMLTNVQQPIIRSQTDSLAVAYQEQQNYFGQNNFSFGQNPNQSTNFNNNIPRPLGSVDIKYQSANQLATQPNQYQNIQQVANQDQANLQPIIPKQVSANLDPILRNYTEIPSDLRKEVVSLINGRGLTYFTEFQGPAIPALLTFYSYYFFQQSITQEQIDPNNEYGHSIEQVSKNRIVSSQGLYLKYLLSNTKREKDIIIEISNKLLEFLKAKNITSALQFLSNSMTSESNRQSFAAFGAALLCYKHKVIEYNKTQNAIKYKTEIERLRKRDPSNFEIDNFNLDCILDLMSVATSKTIRIYLVRIGQVSEMQVGNFPQSLDLIIEDNGVFFLENQGQKISNLQEIENREIEEAVQQLEKAKILINALLAQQQMIAQSQFIELGNQVDEINKKNMTIASWNNCQSIAMMVKEVNNLFGNLRMKSQKEQIQQQIQISNNNNQLPQNQAVINPLQGVDMKFHPSSKNSRATSINQQWLHEQDLQKQNPPLYYNNHSYPQNDSQYQQNDQKINGIGPKKLSQQNLIGNNISPQNIPNQPYKTPRAVINSSNSPLISKGFRMNQHINDDFDHINVPQDYQTNMNQQVPMQQPSSQNYTQIIQPQNWTNLNFTLKVQGTQQQEVQHDYCRVCGSLNNPSQLIILHQDLLNNIIPNHSICQQCFQTYIIPQCQTVYSKYWTQNIPQQIKCIYKDCCSTLSPECFLFIKTYCSQDFQLQMNQIKANYQQVPVVCQMCSTAPNMAIYLHQGEIICPMCLLQYLRPYTNNKLMKLEQLNIFIPNLQAEIQCPLQQGCSVQKCTFQQLQVCYQQAVEYQKKQLQEQQLRINQNQFQSLQNNVPNFQHQNLQQNVPQVDQQQIFNTQDALLQQQQYQQHFQQQHQQQQQQFKQQNVRQSVIMKRPNRSGQVSGEKQKTVNKDGLGIIEGNRNQDMHSVSLRSSAVSYSSLESDHNRSSSILHECVKQECKKSSNQFVQLGCSDDTGDHYKCYDCILTDYLEKYQSKTLNEQLLCDLCLEDFQLSKIKFVLDSSDLLTKSTMSEAQSYNFANSRSNQLQKSQSMENSVNLQSKGLNIDHQIEDKPAIENEQKQGEQNSVEGEQEEQKQKIEQVEVNLEIKEFIGPKKYTCPICYDDFQIDEFRSFPCGHRFCEGCIKSQFRVWYDANRLLFDFDCLYSKEVCSKMQPQVFYEDSNCFFELQQSWTLIYSLVNEFLGENDASNLSLRSFSYQPDSNMIKCPCGYQFMLAKNEIKDNNEEENEEKKDDQVQLKKQVQQNDNTYLCHSCHENYCLKCLKHRHQGKQCDLKDIIQNLINANEMLDENGNKTKTVVCPYCLAPVQKPNAEDCDHINCTCKKEFNFCCGTKRAPCTSHGNHYHRITCANFHGQEYVDNGCKEDKFDPKDCSECKTLGKLCPRPAADLYKGVFPPEMLENFEIDDEEVQN